jgi:beta-glucosidase
VWDQTFGSLKAASFGSQGTRFHSLLWRMQNGELDGYQAKMVVLQGFGTGDQSVGDELVAGYTPIIAEIRARQPQAKILLSAAFPRGRLRRDAWRPLAEANDLVYDKLVDNQTVFYTDLGGRFFRPDGSHNNEMWTMSLPPNAGIQPLAFKVWAEELQPWVDRFLR